LNNELEEELRIQSGERKIACPCSRIKERKNGEETEEFNVQE